MYDQAANVHTHDFEFEYWNTSTGFLKLPGRYADEENEAARMAHDNTIEVAKFIRKELKRNGLDNNHTKFVSSVNCVHSFSHHTDRREWHNACWVPARNQILYGQYLEAGNLISLASIRQIVVHELFHGVTSFTAELESRGEPGALNESYSDIFAILICNFQESNISLWNWEIGQELIGKRSLQNPTLYNQPAHMDDYVYTDEDQGGVHSNNGIHNKAAYNLLTARSGEDYLFTAREGVRLFYEALTQGLQPRSTFSHSRQTLIIRAGSIFRYDSKKNEKIDAISRAFDSVGIL